MTRTATRRILGSNLAVLTAMLLGALASLVVASPVAAHFTSVSGAAVCVSETGQWRVTWQVSIHRTGLTGTLTTVRAFPADSTLTGIAVGATVPNPGTLVGVQMVPGTATKAVLAVRASWPDGFVDSQDRIGAVDLGGSCVPDQPRPSASFTSACDGSVTVHLANDAAATKAAMFTVTGVDFSRTVTVAAGGSEDVVVPAGAAARIDVVVGRTTVATSAWSAPADCAPVKVSSKADCASLTITLENPAGNRPADAVVASQGNSQTVSVPAGESRAVTLPGVAGLAVTVSFGTPGAEPVTITWQPPAACATTPPASPPAGPALPTTGARLTPVIATGSGLLVVGAGVLFVLFRRRRAAQARTF